MKRKILLAIIFCISSCKFEQESDELSLLGEDTFDYSISLINWNSVFLQNNQTYFVYVFSYSCFYCRETKFKIEELYNKCQFPTFFIEYTKEIPIKYDIDKTIGIDKIEQLFIRGTPTLLLINKGFVQINVAGKNDVVDLIDLYL